MLLQSDIMAKLSLLSKLRLVNVWIHWVYVLIVVDCQRELHKVGVGGAQLVAQLVLAVCSHRMLAVCMH